MKKFKSKVAMFTAMLAFVTVSCSAVYAFNSSDVINSTSGLKFNDVSSTRTNIVNTTGKQGNVQQFDARSFNVNKGQTVDFQFSNNSQTTIGRVLGGQESRIMGNIMNSCTAGGCANYVNTSKVILINPAGIMFGQGSQVDLNSFTASTFDIKGIKNLSGVQDLSKYEQELNSKYSPTGKGWASVEFDSNYTEQFEKAGIDMSKFNGKTKITLEGTKFGHFDRNSQGELTDKFSETNTNKSVNILSDNIQYKDSLIRTGGNFNYSLRETDDNGNPLSPYYQNSNSNVRLVTADGATFTYVENGYSDPGMGVVKEQFSRGDKTDVVRTINMDNSGLNGQAAIESGDVGIHNYANAKGSDVKISNTYIKANKLLGEEIDGSISLVAGGEYGNIAITGSKDITINNSKLESNNTSFQGKNTNAQAGGQIDIGNNSGKEGNTTINNSLIKSAGYDKAKFANKYYNGGTNTSGEVYVSGSVNTEINGTRILSEDDATIIAGNKASVNNSLVNTKSSIDNQFSDVNIIGYKQVDIHNGAIQGNNINLDASASGSVNITSDSNSVNYASANVTTQGQAKSMLKAQKDINIKANKTKISDSSLAYNNLKLSDSSYTNNVTVQGNVTLTPNSGKDLNIETNGNLTFDNAQVLYGENPQINVNKDASYNVKVNSSTANNLTGKSTAGNVTVQNNSNLNANNNVNLTSNKKAEISNSKVTAGNDINVNAGTTSNIQASTLDAKANATITSNSKNTIGNSTVNAKTGNASVISNSNDVSITNNSNVEAGNHVNVKGNNVNVAKSNIIAGSDKDGFDKVKDANDTIGDVNIEARTGSVNISGSKVESQDKDVNIKSHDTIAFGTGKNITPDVKIKGTNNVNITSTNGDITAEKTDMGKIEYGNRLKFDAGHDNIFTSADSLKSVNVDYVAKGANRIYTTGDAQFVNSSFTAPNNHVESGSDVILNNHTINSATANAKDTKTEIFANGNVTTDNVTGENLSAKGGTFPQSVNYEGKAVGPNGSNTTLNVNQTKLKVETQTVKDSANPDNGSIKLDLKGANNSQAGVDLVAKNVDKLDKDPTGGYHKTGYFKSGTSKWDQNIDKNQGPEVTVNATDNQLSVANIETDKLNLDPNDKMIADKTNGTPTIEVKDQGGFNLDPTLDYKTDGDGNKIAETGTYSYDDTIESHKVSDEGGDLIMDQDWSEWEPTGREWTDSEGKHIEYQHTKDGRVTDRIVTTQDTKHKITFDNNPEGEFNLIYNKEHTDITPGYEIKADEVMNDPSKIPSDVKTPEGKTPTIDDFIEKKVETEPNCDPAPEIDVNPDSYINRIRLPREQVETSKTSKITDNTVDQSDNVMSAAAKVDLSGEEEANDTVSSTPDNADQYGNTDNQKDEKEFLED